MVRLLLPATKPHILAGEGRRAASIRTICVGQRRLRTRRIRNFTGQREKVGVMADTTEIAWCDSTHNHWLGCMKVSAGCRNCYAESMMDKRYGRVKWGQMKTETTEPSVGTRVLTSEANRRKPLLWNKRALEFFAKHGRRQRVFCSSLADVFDNQVPSEWRADLWALIDATPNLDWLLLTKRPENIRKMMPQSWAPNIWLGTTCEDQAAYDRRWPILRAVPAAVRFISYEPAIGPLELQGDDGRHPDWLICGGESGHGYRDMPLSWASNIMAECGAARVPFFMKQMAGKKPIPPGLMVREFPVVV
jgi:protein gp37